MNTEHRSWWCRTKSYLKECAEGSIMEPLWKWPCDLSYWAHNRGWILLAHISSDIDIISFNGSTAHIKGAKKAVLNPEIYLNAMCHCEWVFGYIYGIIYLLVYLFHVLICLFVWIYCTFLFVFLFTFFLFVNLYLNLIAHLTFYV